MWFRNLLVYRWNTPWDIDAEAFEASLAQAALQPCPSFAMEARGWASPRGEGRFLYTQDRQWLIAHGIEQKLLPSSVVRRLADERAAALGKRQGYPVGRKQLRELRIEITDELLPKAFTRRRTTPAWIDTANRWLGIDVGAESKADELMETLRRTQEPLPDLAPLQTARAPGAMLTHWVASGEAPHGFTIDRDLELQAADGSKATVRYANHDLEGSDIRSHIRAGKTATRLGMTWRDRISFVITDRLQVKRLDFLVLPSETAEADGDCDAKFDADFALMTGELAKCLADLTEALGGPKK